MAGRHALPEGRQRGRAVSRQGAARHRRPVSAQVAALHLGAVSRQQAGQHQRAGPPQVTALHKVIGLAGIIALTLTVTGTQEVTAHGWQFFVNRPPGVGSTPSRPPGHPGVRLFRQHPGPYNAASAKPGQIITLTGWDACRNWGDHAVRWPY